MQSITTSDSVRSIGNSAFNGCINLELITISKCVSSIGYGAFAGCFRLSDVYYGGSEADWNRISIEYANKPLSNATIHYNCNAPYTTTAVSVKDGQKIFTVSPTGIEINDTVIIALYKGSAFIGLQSTLYNGEDIIFETDMDCDKAKVMVWGSFTNLKPVTKAEIVNADD